MQILNLGRCSFSPALLVLRRVPEDPLDARMSGAPGCFDCDAAMSSRRFSISRKDTPRRASSTASVRPAAPAPQMSTSAAKSVAMSVSLCVICT